MLHHLLPEWLRIPRFEKCRVSELPIPVYFFITILIKTSATAISMHVPPVGTMTDL